MLRERLRHRCHGAVACGLALASGYRLAFIKRGRDGSGKATLAASNQRTSTVRGVLYRIPAIEMVDLDRAEVGYRRVNDFPVSCLESGRDLIAMTYIAPPEVCDPGLKPFDWYLALVVVGALQHGLYKEASGLQTMIETVEDPDATRAAKMFRLAERRHDE